MIRKHLYIALVFTVLCALTGPVAAQSDVARGFEFKKEVDIPIIASALGLNSYLIFAEPRVDKLTTEEIFDVHRLDVYRLDRSATYNWNTTARNWSDVTQNSAILLPLTLFLSSNVQNDYKAIGGILLETAGLITGITGVTKISVKRNRPYVYNSEAPIGLKYRRTARYSFFSGHTSISSAMAFAGASIYQEYYPDSPWKKWVWAGAITLPAVTGYLRYEAGKHYITDVITGYAAGALVGYLVPYLHRKSRRNAPLRLNVANGSESAGIQLTYQF